MRAKILFFAISSLLLSGSAYGQAFSPESQATYTAAVHAYASASGQQSLATAIEQGNVIIVAGDPGEGNIAMSFPAPQCAFGDPSKPLIVVPNGASPALVGAAAVHEWTHLENNHPVPSENPSEAEQQARACSEAEAHCSTLVSMQWFYDEQGRPLSCALRNMIIAQLEIETHICAHGPTYAGPPAPAGNCGNVNPYSIPCG